MKKFQVFAGKKFEVFAAILAVMILIFGVCAKEAQAGGVLRKRSMLPTGDRSGGGGPAPVTSGDIGDFLLITVKPGVYWTPFVKENMFYGGVGVDITTFAVSESRFQLGLMFTGDLYGNVDMFGFQWATLLATRFPVGPFFFVVAGGGGMVGRNPNQDIYLHADEFAVWTPTLIGKIQLPLSDQATLSIEPINWRLGWQDVTAAGKMEQWDAKEGLMKPRNVEFVGSVNLGLEVSF